MIFEVSFPQGMSGHCNTMTINILCLLFQLTKIVYFIYEIPEHHSEQLLHNMAKCFFLESQSDSQIPYF